jgi:alpha-1,3-rhamnosyl/mannosyltransferase
LLVCTGTPKEGQSTIVDDVRRLNVANQVRFLGYRPMDEMPALYEGAASLVFPSLFEGFGMPVLEAMWCDCPVVCSNSTSLPEIAGDAALLVNPEAPDEIAAALRASSPTRCCEAIWSNVGASRRVASHGDVTPRYCAHTSRRAERCSHGNP